jgi:hypothetical protein
MRAIVPINDLNRRAPEAGRIRLGERTAKAMRSIDTFRFTSQHQNAIERIASLYGGTVSAFNEPSARIKGWQVKTTSNKIEVLLPPGGLSTWYEKWTGGGCERRCDGVIVEVPMQGPDGHEMTEAPCICVKKGVAECDPHTRLNVILPELDFAGTWRLETKGWNAAQELPGMFDMISEFTASGRMVKAFLHLEPRKTVTNGKTKNFVVPTLSVNASVTELLAGSGTAAPQLTTGDTVAPASAPELSAVPVEADDDIVDAEVVEDGDDDLRVEELARTVADEHDLDADLFVAALWSETSADLSKMSRALERVLAGKIKPVMSGTRLIWETS